MVGAAPWFELAKTEIGVREAPGPANDARVLAYYADAGHPDIRSESVSWCAAYTCAMLERSGHASPKNLAARSFLQWGKPLDHPEVGAVAVLTRGDPKSWTGHVGFVWAWDETRVWLLGGNQGDAVSVAAFPLSAVLGYRVPVTPGNSRTIQAGTVSVAAGATGVVTRAAETAIPAPDTLAQMAEAGGEAGNSLAVALQGAASFLPVLGAVAALISVAAACVILWARLDDLANKGR